MSQPDGFAAMSAHGAAWADMVAKPSGSQPAAGFCAKPYAWNCVQSNRKILYEIEDRSTAVRCTLKYMLMYMIVYLYSCTTYARVRTILVRARCNCIDSDVIPYACVRAAACTCARACSG